MRILDEYDYLIHLVSCTLSGKQPQELPSGMDFAQIYKMAKLHEIANLAFYSIDKLRTKPTIEQYTKWKTSAELCVMRDINQQFAHDEIIAEFKASNIRSLEAQGTIMKQYYPENHYRTMSDIDILIDRENLQKAGKILQKLGYECTMPNDHEINAFRRPTIYIELHCNLIDHEPFYSFLDNAFDIAHSSDGMCYTLDENDFYLFTMFHLLKHLLQNGCGIRRICDIYIINRKLSNRLDMEYLNKQYEYYGVRDIASKIIQLSDVWFGDGEMTSDLTETAKLIKDSGTHGNRIIGIRNELKRTENSSKSRFILSRLFPSKNEMYYIYPNLKKHKSLLLVYYIYRPFHLIVFKRKATINKLKEIMK